MRQSLGRWFFILAIFGILGCQSSVQDIPSNAAIAFQDSVYHSIVPARRVTARMLIEDTINVNHQKFLQYDLQKYHSFYLLLNMEGDTIIPTGEGYHQLYIDDFNLDGNDDLRVFINCNGAASTCSNTYLYDPKTSKYKCILENRFDFEQVRGTDFYFYYHRAGCADMNWESHLMKIENWKQVNLGRMKCYDCGEDRDGVFIYKVVDGKETLVDSFPDMTFMINGQIDQKKNKFLFMKRYWERNHHKF